MSFLWKCCGAVVPPCFYFLQLQSAIEALRCSSLLVRVETWTATDLFSSAMLLLFFFFFLKKCGCGNATVVIKVWFGLFCFDWGPPMVQRCHLVLDCSGHQQSRLLDIVLQGRCHSLSKSCWLIDAAHAMLASKSTSSSSRLC